ncbi:MULTISPECIES: DUF3168 domain-containing protein [unclassified Mesorhizobium]|uniref:DUF3168 domain-containing protein n=1 Tax=unclassified Mesorhizobium TaxID=325217 RepID=UPI001126F3E8|nr:MULTISPECIES: DUF3168 domain-containing protein [unclassified Mesorhizobium]MCA0025472.1 DUF3168 domain-containing protein [Mesorhizobium sp. B263B1A]TPJ97139.1 DUF3168 domain-containing protein [Mesorhizobium sp. B2-5-12]TPK27194.1 DUF3168 domain-containing protein [Mesorhizobium sp. B2-5-6]
MTSPSLELQGAIVARLKALPAVAALIGTRIYDSVPAPTTFPYVTVGPMDELSDDADCITGFSIAVDLNVWSRAVGFPEAERISDAVRTGLLDPELALAANALVYFQHRQTVFSRDPDGLTNRARMSFEAFAEQP